RPATTLPTTASDSTTATKEPNRLFFLRLRRRRVRTACSTVSMSLIRHRDYLSGRLVTHTLGVERVLQNNRRRDLVDRGASRTRRNAATTHALRRDGRCQPL